MLGAAGAILCLAGGTALGAAVRQRRYARLGLIENELDLLMRMRLMLLEERMGLCELLTACASIGDDGLDSPPARRLFETAQALRNDPLSGASGAYAKACRAVPVPWERQEEREAMRALFAQLGTGTAAMREQAVASCMRRLKPILESARVGAERGGKLSMQLGMLLGLMAGVALW